MDQENIDLLDLGEENEEVDTLPEATPFSSPRPKRPWLLMGLGFAVIVLSTWIIVSRIGSNSGATVSVDLDTPVATEEVKTEKVVDLKVPEKAAPVEKVAEKPAPVKEPAPTVKPVENDGTPIRVVEDRKEVTFNPDKAPVEKPAPVVKKTTAKPVAKPAAKPVATKPVQKAPVATANGCIYVQFDSYSTRALAQAAEQKMRASHSSLFAGKQFVILAAQVKGQTIYRLRVPFHSSNDANGFCRNAKSDGLDCYVTK
jgi:hypothetical protein